MIGVRPKSKMAFTRGPAPYIMRFLEPFEITCFCAFRAILEVRLSLYIDHGHIVCHTGVDISRPPQFIPVMTPLEVANVADVSPTPHQYIK